MRRTIAVLAAFASGPASAESLELFTLGSGVVSGGYYDAASAICETVNRTPGETLRCSPDPTSGSIYNLDALRKGHLDLALVQSDWQRKAAVGEGPFAEAGPMTELRSVMGLYPEAMTVLARRDAGIRAVADIVGKRIDIGHPASGRYATNLGLFETLGLDREDFAAVVELPVGAAVDALCAGRVDVTLLITGHPNAATARALAACDAELVPVAGPTISAMVAGSADFAPTFVPIDAYPQLTADVPTFAVTATLVARADTDDAIVAEVVTNVIENLPALGQRSPVLAGLDPDALASRGLTAPLHPAAAAAFAAAQAQ